MAWNRPAAARTTPHTCGGPAFGRLAPRGECRRCDELRFGLPPVAGWDARTRRDEAIRLAAIRAHDCRAAGCGPICVAFDW